MSNSIYSFAAVPSSPYPKVGEMSSFAKLFRKMVMMMSPYSIERGLLIGILDNPDDAFRRQVYADWLEENGRYEEAKCEREVAKQVGWNQNLIYDQEQARKLASTTREQYNHDVSEGRLNPLYVAFEEYLPGACGSCYAPPSGQDGFRVWQTYDLSYGSGLLVSPMIREPNSENYPSMPVFYTPPGRSY